MHPLKPLTSGTSRVQPRVQEPKRRLSLANQIIIQERDNRRESGAGRRGASDALCETAYDDGEVLALGGDVGEAAACGVVVCRVGGSLGGEERGYLGALVGRAGEVLWMQW